MENDGMILNELRNIQAGQAAVMADLNQLKIAVAVVNQRMSEGDRRYDGLQCGRHVSAMAEMEREVNGMKLQIKAIEENQKPINGVAVTVGKAILMALIGAAMAILIK